MKLPKINIKRFLGEAVRVLKLTTRPKKDEFMAVAKITGLLIIVIGFVGFVIKTIKVLFG